MAYFEKEYDILWNQDAVFPTGKQHLVTWLISPLQSIILRLAVFA